jgi:hypothetical protein
MTKLMVTFRSFAKAPNNYKRKIFGHIVSTHRPLYRLHLKRVYQVSIGFYSLMGLYSETYHARFLRDSSRFISHKQSSYFFYRFYKKETIDVTSSNCFNITMCNVKEGSGVRLETQLSWFLCLLRRWWLHVSALLSHLQVTMSYTKEKKYICYMIINEISPLCTTLWPEYGRARPKQVVTIDAINTKTETVVFLDGPHFLLLCT